MPIRIAHGREIPNDAADIGWWLNQNVLSARELGNPIDFCARVALESEVIEASLYIVLHDD